VHNQGENALNAGWILTRNTIVGLRRGASSCRMRKTLSVAERKSAVGADVVVVEKIEAEGVSANLAMSVRMGTGSVIRRLGIHH
jgi:hypothetical protein